MKGHRDMNNKCIICQSEQLEELYTTTMEVFVTGDRKSLNRKNKKIKRVICKECGTVQFLQNEDFKNIIDEVYHDYDVMHDKAWTSNQSKCKPRLQVTYDLIDKAIPLSAQGNMLDIGCGGGEALFYFNQIYPEWNLYGMDIGGQFRESVEKRKNVKKFFSSLNEIKNCNIKFQFISINNTLSLADNPSEILRTVYDILTDDGTFFVRDSDFAVHPWLLYEIESCSFYTKKHMENIISFFGFEILKTDLGFEKKEIGIVSKKRIPLQNLYKNMYEDNKEIYDEKIFFLNRVIDRIQDCLKNNRVVGIFGTSIAGVWVSEIITKCTCFSKDNKIFYVEEDEDFLRKKIGVNGYPICRLSDIHEQAVILLPFPGYIAEKIRNRCERLYSNLEFISFE